MLAVFSAGSSLWQNTAFLSSVCSFQLIRMASVEETAAAGTGR